MMTVADVLRDRMSESNVIRGNVVDLRAANLGFSEPELRERYHWSRDQDLRYWSGNIPTARTFEEFVNVAPERDWPSDGRRRSYAIFDREPKIIGMISCYAIDWGLGTAEMGVYIGVATARGRGLGSDAIVTMVRHLFSDTGLRRIYLNTYASNHRALRAYGKVGFRRIATRRRFRPQIGYYREVRMVLDRGEMA